VSILVVGSVALDSVETPVKRVEDALGGAAVYFSMAARHFSEVRLVGTVGDDFPKRHIRALREAGVNLEGLSQERGSTFRWAGRYHLDMNRRDTLKTELGVFADFKPKIPGAWRDTPFVFLANIDPDLQFDVLRQVKRPRLVACDTMNFWIEGKPKSLARLLKRVDVLTINDEEARMLGGQASLSRSARAVRAMGPRYLIVKRGEYGALLFSGEGVFSAPALLLDNVKDPTGAGDTFAGGFMGMLASASKINDNIFRQAVIMGSVMASFTVEDFSIKRLASVTPQEIQSRYRQFQEITRFSDWEAKSSINRRFRR